MKKDATRANTGESVEYKFAGGAMKAEWRKFFKTYSDVLGMIGVFILLGIFALLLLLAATGCNGVVYIDGSKKVTPFPAGAVITTPDGEKHTLRDAENGGSDKWWLMTDKYLLEIYELIGREGP